MSDRPALPRPLDDVELRVLGTLIEKSLTTPDQYPLTVNSTRVGCNQKTARDPVTEFDERTVYAALGQLRQMEFVRELSPADSRVAKYEHRLGLKLDLRNSAVAVLGLLALRGPQTPGELRQHGHRMHEFADTDAVLEVLDKLCQRQPALAVNLGRAAGQREDRYAHLLGQKDAATWRGLLGGVLAPTPLSGGFAAPSQPVVSGLVAANTLAELRAEVEALKARVEALEAARGPLQD